MLNTDLATTMQLLATKYRVHYALGECLQFATEAEKAKALARFDNGTVRRKQIEEAKPNEYLGDCNCSIKSIVFWGFNFKDGGHAENNRDFNTEEMIGRCRDVSTDFSKCLVGELVYKPNPGHVGIIVAVLADGRIITAECNEKYGKEGMMLTACNCKIKGYDTQTWERHGKIPEIEYVDVKALDDAVAKMKSCVTTLVLMKKGNSGELVRLLQEILINRGYSCGPSGADGDFGVNTEKAVTAFQRDFGLDADGIVGSDTIFHLLYVM